MSVFETAVTVIDNNLAISLDKIPGFGAMGSVAINDAKGERKLITIYYSGGFFKRPSSLEKINEVVNETILLVDATFTDCKAVRVNFSTSIRNQIEQLKGAYS